MADCVEGGRGPERGELLVGWLESEASRRSLVSFDGTVSMLCFLQNPDWNGGPAGGDGAVDGSDFVLQVFEEGVAFAGGESYRGVILRFEQTVNCGELGSGIAEADEDDVGVVRVPGCAEGVEVNSEAGLLVEALEF